MDYLQDYRESFTLHKTYQNLSFILIGGVDKNSECIKNCKIYDKIEDSWEDFGNLIYLRLHSGSIEAN